MPTSGDNNYWDRLERDNERLELTCADLLVMLEIITKDYYEQAGIASLTPESGSMLLYENARAAIARAKGEA